MRILDQADQPKMPEPDQAVARAWNAVQAAIVDAAAVDLSWIQPPPRNDSWSLAPDALGLLVSLVAHVRPRHILEFGSGLSTRVLAWACAEYQPSCCITSIDHDPEYSQIAQTEFAACRLNCHVRFQVAPLVARPYRGKLLPTYHLQRRQFASQRPVDLVLIDGPVWYLGGREGTLYQILEFTRPGTIVLLDDANRKEEAGAVANWQAVLGDAIETRLLPNFVKGLAAIIVREPHILTELKLNAVEPVHERDWMVTPMKKVISFSLWGENPKYTIGAIKNADLATVFYPDWICRFYVAKNVPLQIIQELLARNNTEIFIMNEKPDWTGMFWRFFAACDPCVDVMISRDTDSRLGEREALAVKEWENSDRGFHIMRDHPQHGAKIMGGAWGIKKGIIQNMAELIKKYQKGDFHQVDQNFLREIIYPLIHDNVLVHDPIFDKKPFPSERVGYQFVGQVFDEHDQPVIGHLEDLKRFLSENPIKDNLMYRNTAGTAIAKPMNIKAYKLYDRAAVVQPAAVEREGDAAPGATSASPAMRAASGTGWVLLCPHAFEATWNGGPNPEDIAIRLDATEDDAPAFVQSNLGSGLLTFYPGYQVQTEAPHSLWVRGPINLPKDGLYALEQIVDTSLLPCTITINWQWTRPNQTVRFEAGEPFCALVPHPKQYAEQFECEVVEPDDDGAVLEQALQQLIQAPDLQAVFQRLQQADAPAEPQLAAGAPQEKMKVLIIQENGRHDKNRQFRECFALQSAFQRLGWEADIWGLGHSGFPGFVCSETADDTRFSGSGQDDIHKALDFNAYDVILNLENYDAIGWVPSLTHVKAYKIMWAIDAHVRGIEPFRELYLRDRYDMMLQATRDFIVEEADARIKKNSVWFPNCFNDVLIYPQDIEKKYDVGFCGNIVNRESHLSFIEAHFQLKRDIFVIGADMVRAINSYKIHFNKNIANDINYRNFETIGCRTLLITNANPQYIDLGFVDGENCLIYHDLAELQDKIQYALDHPQQREQIAANGYQLSKRHTYNERVKSLVTVLQRKV